jgi:hypothetical protein
MIEELPSLFDRLRALLSGQPGDASDAHLEDLEHTLTDGYAGALALERERQRTQRRMRTLAAAAVSAEHAQELSELSARLARTEAQLAELRGLLRDVAGARRVA